MDEFTAFVSWPSAPLTNRLVHEALNTVTPAPHVVDTLSQELSAAPGRLLQWATYDALDHDLTFSRDPNSKVLSSSYVIRKALIRKHFLSRCIHNYLTKHPESFLAKGVPRTWELELSFADELDELWGDDLYDLSDEIEKGDPSQWWILKPGMADRGMGLRLFHSKSDLDRIFQEFEQDDSEPDDDEAAQSSRDTAVITSQLRHFVIQEYLAKPLLLDPAEVPLDGAPKPAVDALHGHKFHLRVYCVASSAIKVYMYERILALFSAVPYSPPSKQASEVTEMDLAAHLTNTALQQERGEAGVRLLDELVGCHILSSDPQQQPPRQQPRPPRAMGRMMDPETFRAERRAQAAQAQHGRYPTLTADDVEDLKKQIADVLSETFKAALDMSVHFQPLPNAFELYGTDFVVTQNQGDAEKKFQVNLLEMNSEPAIELTGPRLTWILEDLFKGIAKTCVEPFFSKAGSVDRPNLKVGEAKDHLRLCLDIQVRGSHGW